ncbi:MAG TPA: MBL fold metallo-hydrolase [Chitinophagaceae bacterium]|nr:MBL fold metallo-hydrolase [Chitinophagaceae bacterium]
MKIIPLSEGTFTIDKTKLFVPFDQQTEDLQARPVGSLLVEIQPFVVITTKDILLLDTGLGFSDAQGKMQLHKNLAEAGINPSDITKVLMSHLHKDHAGGISEDSDRKRLCFPAATHYIQQKELDFSFEKGLPSFIPDELEVLKDSKQVQWLMEEEGIIDDYIHYKVTGAHSPFHQVFWIKEQNETIFFGADDAPQLQQMKHRFVAKYDFDGKKAMELRREWWERGEKEKWTFLFYHDVQNPVYTF